MFLEERFGLRARKEHKQQQPQLIEQIERGLLGVGGDIQLQGVGIKRQPSEHKGSEQDTGQDFANHARLAQAGEQIAQGGRRGEEDREKEKKRPYSKGG